MTIQASQDWYVYILQCSDDTFYTGVTTDLQRRLHQHNHNKQGARYTAARRPVKLVYHEQAASRAEAQQREYQIRTLPRSVKQQMACEFKTTVTAPR